MYSSEGVSDVVAVIYSIVVFLATFVGASTGLGGGIIIKPALDLVGADQVATISAYSSMAVFTMCMMALSRRLRIGLEQPIRKKVVIGLAGGAVVGGFLGEVAFRQLVSRWQNTQVSGTQSLLLLIVVTLLILLSLWSPNRQSFRVTSGFGIFGVGLGVGALSVFLGIGGGPINMAVLLYLFAMPAKEAAFYSLVMIFFAQVVKVSGIMMSWQSLQLRPIVVISVLLCAILGGYVGIQAQQRLRHRQVLTLYHGLMLVLWVMTAFQLFRNI